MRASIRDQELLSRFDVSQVRTYLAAHGWSETSYGSRPATLWFREADDAPEVILPDSNEARDFEIRVGEMLAAIERVEARSQLEIARDIALVTADVIRLRCPTDDPSDALLLVDGAKLLEQATAMMASAAASAVTPRRVLAPRRPVQAIDYMKRVRLGQTERGSFVLTIISDVRPLNTPGAPGLLEYMGDPFPRRVTRTLVNALQGAVWAAEKAEANLHYEVFESVVDNGVSANFCESVAGLLSAAHRLEGLTVEVQWAPSNPINETSRTILPSKYAVALSEGAKYLRDRDPFRGIAITGIVERLSRGAAASSGTVVVSCVVDGTLRKLLVTLGEGEYETAIDAHRKKLGVFFTASVEKVGRQYHATEVTGFRLVDANV
jgi:hypothetical protein